MGLSSPKKTLVFVIAMLMLICLGDAVHALVPGAAENAGCDSGVCIEPSGCATGVTFKPTTPPMVMVVTPFVVTPPLRVVPSRHTAERSLRELRPVTPRAPRSPPSA
jgi:hypothetical protein